MMKVIGLLLIWTVCFKELQTTLALFEAGVNGFISKTFFCFLKD